MRNLQARIEEELQRVRAASGATTSKHLLSISMDGGQLEIRLTAVDSLACAVESVVLQTNRLADASVEQLERTAKSLGSRLGYLLEQVSPVEIDGELGVVQMRSQPPARDANGTSYYELLVRRGEIRLSRYRKPPTESRRMVPTTVTEEVLQKLAADIIAAADRDSSQPELSGKIPVE